MLIGYRCKVCGAPVDPETGYCRYCDTLNYKPIIRKPIINERPRIIVRDNDKEAVIFPREMTLTVEDSPTLEITALGDTRPRFIHYQYARFQIVTTLRPEQAAILSRPVFDAVFTGYNPGYAHDFKAYASRQELSIFQGVLYEDRIDIMSANPVDLWNTRRIHDPILEGMKCPICGADLDPEKSKCDYCGYWWIYSQER